MQRRVLKEDVFDKPLVNLRINLVAGIDNILERSTAFDNNKSTHFAARHTHTSHHNGDNHLLIFFGFAVVRTEKAHKASYPLVGAKRIKKLAYFFLKKDNQCYHTHTDKLIENATQKTHLENLTNQ